jgi:hypothetical protein
MAAARKMFGGCGGRRIIAVAGLDYVRGVARYTGRNFVSLVAEPENHFDPNAIAVIAEDGHHLGYVPAHITSEVRGLITLPYDTEVYIEKDYDAEGRAYYSGQLLI